MRTYKFAYAKILLKKCFVSIYVNYMLAYPSDSLNLKITEGQVAKFCEYNVDYRLASFTTFNVNLHWWSYGKWFFWVWLMIFDYLPISCDVRWWGQCDRKRISCQIPWRAFLLVQFFIFSRNFFLRILKASTASYEFD